MSMYNTIENYISNSQSSKSIAYSHLAGNGAVANLEAKLCSLYGAKHALCVDSATNGLMYLLLAAGLQSCEILTTSLSFGGTIAGAMTLGCKFHFADLDDNLNIDVKSVEKILSANPHIKCVLPVDFAGNPHDMKSIHEVCDQYGIWHFTDAAQSLGAICEGTAQFNDALVVSFGSGKAIYAGGEGGAIITDNSELYDRLLLICQHPHRQERDLGIGYSNEFSLNGRMHPIAAILANDLFETGLEQIEAKRAKFLKALSIISEFRSIDFVPEQKDSAFYHCPVFVKDSELFVQEFDDSQMLNDFHYSRAKFVLLPTQLNRLQKDRLIKSCDCIRAEDLLDRLYLLHLNE